MSNFGFDKIINRFESRKDAIASKLIKFAQKWFILRFEMNETPEDIPWPTLTPKYKEYKAKMGWGNKMLVAENHNIIDALKSSTILVGQTWNNCRLELPPIMSKGSKNKPPIDYAVFQNNEKGDNGAGRTFVGSSDRLEMYIEEKLVEEINKLFKI